MQRDRGLATILETFVSSVETQQYDFTRREWYEYRGFHPHPGQEAVIAGLEDKRIRRLFIVAGKRAGKSELVRQEAIYQLVVLAHKVWIAGPDYATVDKLWTPIVQACERLGARVVERHDETRFARFSSGAVIEGIPWTNVKRIEREGIHCLITDESQYLTPTAESKFAARLVGDWVWISIGSPAEGGQSNFEEKADIARRGLISSWAYYTWPTWANPDADVQMTIGLAREELEEIKQKFGEEHPLYLQRSRDFRAFYGAESLPPPDVALAQFDPALHVRPCKLDEDLPVQLWIDPGYFPGAYAVVVVQMHPYGTALGIEPQGAKRSWQEVWQIDEVYAYHMTPDDVIQVCTSRPWWKIVESATIDVAAKQVNRQTGVPEISIWQKALRGKPVTARAQSIADGLLVHRRFLRQNRLFHDKEATPNTQSEYRNYKMSALADVPVDRENHAMKAIAYGLLSNWGTAGEPVPPLVWESELPSLEAVW